MLDENLAMYRQPGPLTAPGRCAAQLADLPRDPAGLIEVVQGLLIHEFLVGAYDVTLTDERRQTVHLRSVEEILAHILAEDDRPLTEQRDPAGRLAGNCRHFTLLMVTMLRAQGIPARARCGFGGYFGNGWFEDHWVCERWDAATGRWVLTDAQIDPRQREMFGVDFDLLDVPRDRFLTGGGAWRRCRSGADDPSRFGLSIIPESGMWWIAGNLIRDVAALNNMELLPWDCWGAMPKPNADIDDVTAGLFDELAERPDGDPAELAARYRADDRLRVPEAVYNELRDRMEPVTSVV